MNSASPILRRRPIEDSDLASIADLLTEGFPERTLQWWRRGLERLRRLDIPEGVPRYGIMLEFGGRPVGVLLMIHAEIGEGAHRHLRCNLSSWHTNPTFAAHSPLLLGASLRTKGVTRINISPAPHTQPIIEAQGFRPFARGSLATLPLLSRRREKGRARWLRQDDIASFAEARLLADHIAFGCLCLFVEAGGERYPFVFSRPRRLKMLVPATQLLYCRDIEDYVRFAGSIGRALLARGLPIVLVDGPERLPDMPGRLINPEQNKYVLGPNPPRHGDLAYSELALLG